MVPRSITSGLASLRRRERFLQLGWGAARLSALVVILLLAGGFLDWLVDREEDTPWALRISLFVVQTVVVFGAAVFFLVRPVIHRLRDDELALWVEGKTPRLDQRLISAVQLNQEGADTEGMSPELIAQVTREAEKQAGQIPFAKVADHRRLAWSAWFAGPAFVAAITPFLIWPDLASALLSRQFLADRDIPRSVMLVSVTDPVYPQGEKVVLRYRVTGKDLADLSGEVRVKPEGKSLERYELILDDKAPATDGEVYYVATLPAAANDFTYRAWLGDGRSRESKIRFVPLPAVTRLLAWVQLPAFCGLKPNGQRYEISQPQADIAGITGASARVMVRLQKPVEKVILHVGRSGEQEGAGRQLAMTPRQVARILGESVEALKEQNTEEMVDVYEATFDLDPEDAFYEIEAVDEYGFVNKPRPRRSLRVIPEDAPQVALLKEQFPPRFLQEFGFTEGADDAVVEGIPVLLGGKIRIPYQAYGPYGLGQARILYRLVPNVESGNEQVKEVPWTVLLMPEVKASPDTGPFLSHLGAFANSPFLDSISFHAVPSDFPDIKLGRTQGGGRYDLATTGLVDHQGKPITVKIGDQIEYCVEVFADKNADPKRPSARSERRVKTIVSLLELTRWMEDTTREEQTIRGLDKKQRGVFEK